MNGVKRIFTFAVAFVGATFSVTSDAQTRGDIPVRKGALLRDVLAVWGEPDERIVRSVKHELVWRYKGGAFVVFKDGQVSKFQSAASEQIQHAKKVAAVEAAKAAAVMPNESKDFLRDIVREIPSGGDSSGPPEPMPSNDPALAGLIPNAIPQRNGLPGVAPGSVMPIPDEEQE